ncbi:MAG: DUF4386 family protein [Sporichthyaceae bacterium]
MTPAERAVQRAMAWCGMGFVVVFGAGLLVTGWVPPIPPDWTAEQTAAHYQENAGRIRTGCLLMLIGAGFTVPFWAAVSAQMKRIDSRFAVLAQAQLLAGAVAVLVFTIPVVIFSAAAFRPERDPVVTQALNDVGWFFFLFNFPSVTFQAIVIAVAVFSDRNPDPVFPRWLGYALVWSAIGFVPGGLLTYFKTGPFAWNGLFSWWVAAVAFFSWFLVMIWATLRAIARAPRPAPDPMAPISAADVRTERA